MATEYKFLGLIKSQSLCHLVKTPPGLDEDANLFRCLKPSRGEDSASLLDLGSPESRGDKEGDMINNFSLSYSPKK
jgi:hypothetical protein